MHKIVLIIGALLLATACQFKPAPESNAEEKSEAINLIQKVDGMSNFNEIINNETPVLVDFYADWCAPCKMMAPILEQFAREMNGTVKVIKVNVDKNREAAAQYGIRSIPTMILFQQGVKKWQGVGIHQADQLKSIVEQNR